MVFYIFPYTNHLTCCTFVGASIYDSLFVLPSRSGPRPCLAYFFLFKNLSYPIINQSTFIWPNMVFYIFPYTNDVTCWRGIYLHSPVCPGWKEWPLVLYVSSQTRVCVMSDPAVLTVSQCLCTHYIFTTSGQHYTIRISKHNFLSTSPYGRFPLHVHNSNPQICHSGT